MTTAAKVKSDLAAVALPAKVYDYQWFFKTGPGEYAEGDKFIGVTVPNTRKVASNYKTLSLPEIQKLFDSKIHEHRLCALHILVGQFKAAKSEAERKTLFDFYLQNVYAQNVNNWDLVDTSAPYFGAFLIDRSGTTKLLNSLIASDSLWERRVGVIFTFAFIRDYRFDEILSLAKSY